MILLAPNFGNGKLSCSESQGPAMVMSWSDDFHNHPIGRRRIGWGDSTAEWYDFEVISKLAILRLTKLENMKRSRLFTRWYPWMTRHYSLIHAPRTHEWKPMAESKDRGGFDGWVIFGRKNEPRES